jgi:hypothetical protein
MKLIRIVAPAAVVTFVVTASACAQSTNVDAAGWLAGCWAAGSGGRVVEEQWMAPRGGLMIGMSRSIRDGTARGYEFVLIRHTEEGVVYAAHPSGQQPADFAAELMKEDRVPSHLSEPSRGQGLWDDRCR